MIPMLIGAALGLAKAASDQAKEKRDRAQASTTAAWSPWTKLQPDKVQSADPIGTIGQGAFSGAQFEAANPNFMSTPGGSAAAAASNAAPTDTMSYAQQAPGQAMNAQQMQQRFPWAAQQPQPAQSSWNMPLFQKNY